MLDYKVSIQYSGVDDMMKGRGIDGYQSAINLPSLTITCTSRKLTFSQEFSQVILIDG